MMTLRDLARLAMAGYAMDADHCQMLAPPGCAVHAMLWDDDQEIVAFVGDILGGPHFILFQGTRFTENTDPMEILDDLEMVPFDVGGGALMPAGFGRPLENIMPELMNSLPDGVDLLLIGHSLGGVRAMEAPWFLRGGNRIAVVSFGAPKGGNDVLWRKIFAEAHPEATLIRVVNRRDFAPHWPPLGYCQPTGGFFQLVDGVAKPVSDYEFILNISRDDHMPDAYVEACPEVAVILFPVLGVAASPEAEPVEEVTAATGGEAEA